MVNAMKIELLIFKIQPFRFYQILRIISKLGKLFLKKESTIGIAIVLIESVNDLKYFCVKIDFPFCTKEGDWKITDILNVRNTSISLRLVSFMDVYYFQYGLIYM